MAPSCETWSGHVIVCGLDGVGLRTVEQLRVADVAVAVVDDDGYYFIVDRARDIVISGGLNVYPAEVEAALGRHPDVQDVAVIGVPDDKWGESVKALVVRRTGSSVGESELLEHCSHHLAGYKKPSAVVFVDILPRNAAGKVLKTELRARAAAG